MHGPYRHGSASMPAVNSPVPNQWFRADPPDFADLGPAGLGLPSVFVSEFGSSVMSSFESMSKRSHVAPLYDGAIQGGRYY